MQQGRFAQRELVDDTDKGQRVCTPARGLVRSSFGVGGPSFAELDQSGLDLRRVQRSRRLFPNPTIPAIHLAKHHAILVERPANALSRVRTQAEAPEHEALFAGFGIQPDSCQQARHRAPRERPARSLCAGGEFGNIRSLERGSRS